MFEGRRTTLQVEIFCNTLKRISPSSPFSVISNQVLLPLIDIMKHLMRRLKVRNNVYRVMLERSEAV